MITERDQLVLLALARYYLLHQRHVQQICFPHAREGRVARRRLAALADEGLIHKHSTLVASAHAAVPAPVYSLTVKGCEYLAEETGDISYLSKPVDLPHRLHLGHAMAVVDFHIAFDVAIAAQGDVVLEAWHNEADVVNADELDPAKHYGLHTKFEGKPGISCSPDAGFLLNRGGRRSAFYLELERGDGKHGTGARPLAERKCPGYAELARRQLHLKHFPAADIDEFRVVLIAPHAGRRDAIRVAFQERDAAAFRTDLWRFAAMTEITAETLLQGEVFYRCGQEPPERLLLAGGAGRDDRRVMLQGDGCSTARHHAR